MKSFACLAGLLLAGPALATTYTLEPNYTQVVFNWDHLGYSFPTAQIARGTGTIEFDAMNPTQAKVMVTLPLAMIVSGVPDLDEHLKSEDFFDVAKHPEAIFTSTKVEKGMSADRLLVTGDLRMHAVTKPLTLDVKILKVGSNARTGIATVGFNATAKLKRSDFGLGAFVPQVGDEIMLTITCQGAEAKAYAAYLESKEEKK
ncbi:MAG: polyisoprenoid-binding protein [Steroidobacteraceae bacterium]|nr:polyisoprenoid-binding protein [Steroidobacteraceae bacterium]